MRAPRIPAFLFFLALGWLLLNLLQASQTELLYDEAYYWELAKTLDWGYFDHPPMIALLIKAGAGIIHGEIGVRLTAILSSFITLILVYDLARNVSGVRDVKFFILLALAFPAFHIYAFIQTPDTALLMFTAVFLWLYYKFLQREDWLTVIALGVTMAAMAYSKYHGGLVVLLVVLSNPRILLNSRIWVAAGIALLLFIPHLQWQLERDFVTFEYQLLERSANRWRLKFIDDYLLNQALFHGVWLFPAVLYIFVRYRARDDFERSLRFIFWGFLLVFFIGSLTDRVEPHWTAMISIPVLIWSYNCFPKMPRFRRAFLYLVIPLYLSMLLARIFVAVPMGSFDYYAKMEFFSKPTWLGKTIEMSAGQPVLFTDSYQRTSKFRFYADQEAFTSRSVHGRDNQLISRNEALAFHDRNVFVCTKLFWDGDSARYDDRLAVPVPKPVQARVLITGDSNRTLYGFSHESYQAIDALTVTILNPSDSMYQGTNQQFSLLLKNPTELEINFGSTLTLGLAIFENRRFDELIPVKLNRHIDHIPPGNSILLLAEAAIPTLKKGQYQFAFSVYQPSIHYHHNMEKMPFPVSRKAG